MKILVVGYDGGDRRIIDVMDMPNMQHFMQSGITPNVTEDLCSRGWAALTLGVHGRESGAFYTKPVLGSPGEVTQSFGMADVGLLPNIKPIWQAWVERNLRVGVMNVPGTMPATKVNGFFVSGAGGGLKTSGLASLPEDAVYPPDLSQLILKEEYVFDRRFSVSNITDWDQWFNMVIEMESKRIDTYIAAAKQYQIDAGFLALMGTNRIQNLAMYEIEQIIEQNGEPKSIVQEGICDFYKKLDACFGKIMDSLQPTYQLVVADHGQAPYLHSCNPNVFLKRAGFQSAATEPKARLGNLAKKIGKNLLPGDLWHKVRRRHINVVKSFSKPDIDFIKTRAFSERYVPGIYINDDERFGGPVKIGTSDHEYLLNELIETFNASEEADIYGLSARRYRSNYPTAKHENLLPDIWIDHPDSVFFEGRGEFVEANPNYGPIKSLKSVSRDMWTGVKGRHPLVIMSKNCLPFVEEVGVTDLASIYNVAVKVAQK